MAITLRVMNEFGKISNKINYWKLW